MALYGGKRDARLVASFNAEILNAIVDTEIEFFKLQADSSETNIYGESTKKSYYDSILIPCLVTKDEKNAVNDDYGQSYTRTASFAISRDILERSGFYPETGDVIFWDNEYYEIDNIDANQYFAGKNPETWPNGSEHGYSVSVICNTHATRQTPHGIKSNRFGGSNKFGYKH